MNKSKSSLTLSKSLVKNPKMRRLLLTFNCQIFYKNAKKSFVAFLNLPQFPAEENATLS